MGRARARGKARAEARASMASRGQVQGEDRWTCDGGWCSRAIHSSGQLLEWLYASRFKNKLPVHELHGGRGIGGINRNFRKLAETTVRFLQIGFLDGDP